ncbi:PH domain-containing protein [Niallia nealsonii]|uniref:YdbS-like PH domain-containing protein n=1 Tax=Niallia nealsonii TaxID=115979 RepID=A0A2N0Z2F8_9BACI|nr:PH domain-containing protein [Niallia nealsonii]PKG23682.1 hypothetical protein CWS01_10695 [Niallia nealsonii]
MLAEPYNRLSPKSVEIWRIMGVISGLFLFVVFAGVITLTVIFHWHLLFSIISFLIITIYFVLFVGILPKMKWKRWRYEIREDEIEIQQGVLVIKRTLVPMIRVQHVDTKQGPLLRKYHLATVSISTAATVHEIPALGLEEAEEIRTYISVKTKVAKEDV